MASRYAPIPAKPAGGGEAIEYRLLVAAVFAGCLPVATARWLRPDASGAEPRRTPFALALESARNTVAQAYSLPG